MSDPHTEMGQSTRTKLSLISEKAREDPECKFTSLAHLLNEGFLTECHYMPGRDRASGIDGVSWKEYGENLANNISELVGRMKRKQYKPQAVRRVYIPKDKQSTRPIGILTVEDKIVQKGISFLLEAIYEKDFLDCSYGFRPNRNCHQALNAVDKSIMRNPINHIVEADIKGFFDNVSHIWLMRFIEHRIKDASLLFINQEIYKSRICGSEYVP